MYGPKNNTGVAGVSSFTNNVVKMRRRNIVLLIGYDLGNSGSNDDRNRCTNCEVSPL